MNRAQESYRVIYIMGSGRSGSTVLDIILGHLPDAVSVGELSRLPQVAWVENNYCSCGERARACPFWSEISDRWRERTGGDHVGDFIRLQRLFEGRGGMTRLLADKALVRRRFDDYAFLVRALFGAIAEVSGKSLVIDSSKQVGRAFALVNTPDLDVRLLHLIRDGRGVAWSLHKAYKRDDKAGITRDFRPRPMPRTLLSWTKVNLLSEWVRGQVPRESSLKLRYEDVMRDPAEELRRLGPLIGVEMSPVIDQVLSGEPFEVGHNISGNRLRMSGSVRFKPDREWMTKMSRATKQELWLLYGSFLRRYGYEREEKGS